MVGGLKADYMFLLLALLHISVSGVTERTEHQVPVTNYSEEDGDSKNRLSSSKWPNKDEVHNEEK